MWKMHKNAMMNATVTSSGLSRGELTFLYSATASLNTMNEMTVPTARVAIRLSMGYASLPGTGAMMLPDAGVCG